MFTQPPAFTDFEPNRQECPYPRRNRSGPPGSQRKVRVARGCVTALQQLDRADAAHAGQRREGIRCRRKGREVCLRRHRGDQCRMFFIRRDRVTDHGGFDFQCGLALGARGKAESKGQLRATDRQCLATALA